MAAYYGNDFEVRNSMTNMFKTLFKIFSQDPRLSVVGFVTDYVVWRLAVDGYEW